MHLRVLVSVSAICILSPNSGLAEAIVEGRVNLPKSHAPPPVMAKRYEIVTNGGVLATKPHRAVVYLDDTYHNIFSYSPAKRFDLGRYRPEERPIPSVVFDVAGLVTLRCDIHDHMRGLILVLNTPYFVITDESGRFRLSGLPAGHYTLKAWIDSKTTREQPVELKSGATLRTDFP